jgi:hypothetical protein
VTDKLHELFDQMVVGEPPLRVTADGVAYRGRRRQARRRTWMVTGSAVLAVGALAGTAVAWDRPAGPVRTPFAGPPPATGAARQSAGPGTPPPEIPRCPAPDAPLVMLDDTDGSVLPDPQRAAQAVLAAAPAIAPGRTFQLVRAEKLRSSPKHDAPREYLIFDVGDADGHGSINLEIIPQRGRSPGERAEHDVRARPFANCTDAGRRFFPDGSVGLTYVPFGTGRPSDTVLHARYYGAGDVDVNAGCFQTRWVESSRSAGPPVGAQIPEPDGADPDRPVPTPADARTTMPLTPDQMLDLAAVAVSAR